MMTDEDKDFIRDTINLVVKDRFDLIIRKVDSIQQSVDNLITDTDADRNVFSELSMGMATIIRGQKEIIDTRRDQNKRIVEDVKNHTGELVQQVTAELSDQIEPVVQKAFLSTHLGIPMKKRKKLLSKILFWRK